MTGLAGVDGGGSMAIDEKSQILARDRAPPEPPLMLGKNAMVHDHKRKGPS